jgi:hypothetical protein
VCLFHCGGASPEILEIFPEIPDFLETPEYPGFTDKIVLSGDFRDSPIHPPLGDIKILSHPIRNDKKLLITMMIVFKIYVKTNVMHNSTNSICHA